jgi:hypothetical protein
VQREPAGSDRRRLLREPLLEHELGLDPAPEVDECQQPGTEGGDRRLARTERFAQRVHRRRRVAEDDVLLGREVVQDGCA